MSFFGLIPTLACLENEAITNLRASLFLSSLLDRKKSLVSGCCRVEAANYRLFDLYQFKREAGESRE